MPTSPNGWTYFQNLRVNDLEYDNKLRICKMPPLHPNWAWVKNFDPLTLSAKKQKIEFRVET